MRFAEAAQGGDGFEEQPRAIVSWQLIVLLGALWLPRLHRSSHGDDAVCFPGWEGINEVVSLEAMQPALTFQHAQDKKKSGE